MSWKRQQTSSHGTDGKGSGIPSADIYSSAAVQQVVGSKITVGSSAGNNGSIASGAAAKIALLVAAVNSVTT